MIQSYIDEVHSRRNKAAIFWFVVFIFSCFLFLFFQGYYVNIDFKINSKTGEISKPILKQFGIINIKVFPSPDNIFINGKSYNNGSKDIYGYGKYRVEIYKSGSIASNFDILLNKDYPIFNNTINIFKKFEYNEIPSSFDNIEKINDSYFIYSNSGSIFKVIDSNFELVDIFDKKDYEYIGNKFFKKESQIFAYDFEKNQIMPYLSKNDKLPVYCSQTSIYHYRLFCYDIMDFIDGERMKGEEKVIKINDNLILTKNYIYNNGNGGDWGTYEHLNKNLSNGENLIHIENMPYILENGILYNLEDSDKNKLNILELDKITFGQEFANESILVGQKNSKNFFVLFDEKRKYTGNLDNIDLKKLVIKKYNGAYIFNTRKNLYLYYKGSKNLVSILSGDEIKILENRVFFKKDGKNYILELSIEE